MRGTTTRWAMRIASSMWHVWWGPRFDGTSRGPKRLYRRHGGLLGLHADRWRAADAGAPALPHARVHPGAAGLSVRALRDRGYGDQPVRGLDRGAVRSDGDALRRARPSGAGPHRPRAA